MEISNITQIKYRDQARVRKGFLRLMRGTANNGCLFIGDAGFVFPMPKGLGNQGVLSPREFCEQNGIPFMVPFTARSGLGLKYTLSTHTLTQVPAVEAMVSSY